MEGGAGVSPISSCADSSSGSQPGSKAPCSWAGKPFDTLGPCELLCLFGPEKCLLARNKTYKTLPQQTKPTILINETVSLEKSGPCRECHLAADVNTLLLSSGSPPGTAAKDRGWHLGMTARDNGSMSVSEATSLWFFRCLLPPLYPQRPWGSSFTRWLSSWKASDELDFHNSADSMKRAGICKVQGPLSPSLLPAPMDSFISWCVPCESKPQW